MDAKGLNVQCNVAMIEAWLAFKTNFWQAMKKDLRPALQR